MAVVGEGEWLGRVEVEVGMTGRYAICEGQKQTSRMHDVIMTERRGRRLRHGDAAGAPYAGLGVATHLHRLRGLPVGVVRMGDVPRRGHHHRVRHGMLHCSKITISHHELSCGHQVIGDWRTLRALVVVVGMRVRRYRGRRH